jgi:hypothetical protein
MRSSTVLSPPLQKGFHVMKRLPLNVILPCNKLVCFSVLVVNASDTSTVFVFETVAASTAVVAQRR